MKHYLFIGFILLFVFSFDTMYAQHKGDKKKETTAKESPEVVLLRQQSEAFINAYANVAKSKNKDEVLKYIHEKVTSNLFSVSISGQVKLINSDFNGFDDHLKSIIASQDEAQISYKLKEITRVYANSEGGVLSYIAENSSEKDGEVWSRSNETVTLTYKKFGTDWKIIHYTSVILEDEKLKGTCYCEFFESKPGNYVAKTLIPGGKIYETKLLNFEFKSSTEAKFMVKVENTFYKWTTNDELISYNPDPKAAVKEEVLGVSRTKEEAITLIIQKGLFPENCAVTKMRKQ